MSVEKKITLVAHYRVTPTDTANIRILLKAEGLKIKHCRLGSNRFYILINTSDNLKARFILNANGYELNEIWKDSHIDIFQSENMMIHKTRR